jgi:hypothetical protein
MGGVNIWAVLVAAASSFLLGGLWYSKALFGPAWGRAAGMPIEGKHPHAARVFGVSFVFALIAAAAFGRWLGPNPTLGSALLSALIAGLGFVGACFGINYQFADRKPMMWLIDSGYHTAQFMLFGIVFALWPK